MASSNDPVDSSDDPLLKRAASLVTRANAIAVTLFVPMFDEHSCLRSIKPQEWDFCVTVAFVFTALTQLNHENLPEQRVGTVLDRVSEDFSDWQADAPAAFEDCKAFYDRSWDGVQDSPSYSAEHHRFLSADVIGMWITWNLLKHPPESEDERAVARQIGVVATHEFTTWWRS